MIRLLDDMRLEAIVKITICLMRGMKNDESIHSDNFELDCDVLASPFLS